MPPPRTQREVDEGPDEADLERFGSATVPCPKCGAAVYDEAEWCHKCGHVLGDGTDGKKMPVWVYITVAVAVGVVAFYFVF